MSDLILLLASLYLGAFQVTAYRSVPQQTDSSPYYTSIGERVNVHGCAVSQDMLRKNGGKLDYGDLLYIQGIGFKFVNDVMNKRHHQRIDIWVTDYEAEKRFDKKFGGKPLKAWIVKGETQHETHKTSVYK